MATRFTIDLEDMDEASAGGLGLWLDMMFRDEADHRVLRLTYERNVTCAPIGSS